MEQSHAPKRSSYGAVASVLVVLLISAACFAYIRHKKNNELTANFNVSYPKPDKDWVVLPHGPQYLFQYEEPKRGLTLRGAVNQMVSDVNPTPDLDRDHVAKLVVDNTLSNMPGWTAEVKDIVQSEGTSFRIVRRTQRNQTVVTAFSVEGNTTLLVSLSARDKKSAEVDKGMDEFRDFIKRIKLARANTSAW
jgi:hypothetical protein